ncbi:MAG: hypothetical protein UY62_C0053G0009 [Parcubacteria group bacterium GW2011_GWF2_50_9]|nr:MAG: hypothetical protein UY62_C0053G0009 [Parcubacteria group bacterium GW2011_GWF2_50_9]
MVAVRTAPYFLQHFYVNRYTGGKGEVGERFYKARGGIDDVNEAFMPWLEAIEIQDSAFPYHDWNERITAECYAANAVSRICLMEASRILCS